MKFNRWTAETLARLHELQAEGLKPETIAAKMGYGVARIKCRIKWENMTDEQRAKRSASVTAARRRRAAQNETVRSFERIVSRPMDELFAERDARLLAPRTISQAMFGDPPVGFSALERRA